SAPVRSYISSTGVSPLDQPGREDVTGCVDVPVMDGPAGAGPFADGQRQGLGEPAAGRADLRRREPAVHGDDAAPGAKAAGGALPMFPSVGFPEPPPEPGVHLSMRRALHKSRTGFYDLSSLGRPGGGDGCAPVSVSSCAHRCRVEQLSPFAGRPPAALTIAA